MQHAGSTGLRLADGSAWVFAGADDRGAKVVRDLAAIAKLGASAGPAARVLRVGALQLPAGAAQHFTLNGVPFVSEDDRTATLSCRLPAPLDETEEALFPLQVLNAAAYFSMLGGGALLHAALLAYEGRGFLVAGRSGVGKSTAASRVPPPWEAPADETVLVVRAPDGRWMAHPWPNWGRLAVEGTGSWEVQRAVPVEGVFFLEQGARDEALPLGRGRALCFLAEVAEQVTWPLAAGMDAARQRELRLRQFEHLARLAAEVSCHNLHATLHGAFWEEMLRAVGRGRETACARS